LNRVMVASDSVGASVRITINMFIVMFSRFRLILSRLIHPRLEAETPSPLFSIER
jgi:hypothetical protein